MIKKPLTTEKAIRLIESDNTIIFEVESKENKKSMKKHIENLFHIKVERINILNKGAKKFAYVKLNKANPAIDVATKLGMI